MAMITGRDFGTFTPDAAALVVGDSRASADERVHVYAHMYRSRIAEALESQFPRLAKHLGADAFAELAAAYIDDEPSRHPSLRYVGERLPAWLAARRADAPTLVGLAALEWARADVFDLADDPTMTLDELRAWPVESFGELPLHLVTAHRLVTVAAGAMALWDSLGADVVTVSTQPVAGTESFLVWREGTIVYHRVIDEPERRASELAAVGTHFGVICEGLLPTQTEDAAVAQAYGWMSTWLADGLLRPARLG
jgi:hypothetical protein